MIRYIVVDLVTVKLQGGNYKLRNITQCLFGKHKNTLYRAVSHKIHCICEIHWINLSSGLFGKHQKSKKYTGFHKIQWIFYLTFFEKKLDKKIQESAGFYFFGFLIFNMVIRYDFTSIDTKPHTYKPIGKLISFSFGKIKKQNTLDNIIQWNIFIQWIILSTG